jgi:hypothetical protein
LRAACSFSGRISALKVPSAAHNNGYGLDIRCREHPMYFKR